MTIYINEEDKKLFEQNGFNQQSVGDTVNHYRSQGLSDDDIQTKINQRLEGWRTPKQDVKTDYTYPNQDINGISPENFKKNIDSIYNIPQVPMPPRNNAGYTNSDGEVRSSLPTFAENHPVVDSILNRIKQIPSNIADFNNKIGGIGDQSQNINTARGFVAPQYQPNGTPLLTGGVSKKSFLNDQRYWLKTKANKAGDALLRIASNMGNSNPYGNLQPVQSPVKTTVNENGQKVIDYSKESPMEMKVAGSRADYETLKDIRRNPDNYFKPVHTDKDYEAIKTSLQNGSMSYEAAKNAWDKYNAENLIQKQKADNAARVLTEDAQRKIRNLEIGEKVLDAGLWGTIALNVLTLGGASIPTVGGKVVTSTLKSNIKKEMMSKLIAEGFVKKDAELLVAKAAEQGIVDKGVQLGLENYSKNLMLGELGGKVATNAALGGMTGMVDVGLLGTGLNEYAKYLGVSDTPTAEAAANSMGTGALGGAILAGGATALSPVAAAIGKIPLYRTYEPLPNAVTKYTGKPYQSGMNYMFKPDTDFVMGEGSNLRYPNREPQDVQYNGAEELKQIAPKTMEKLESNPIDEYKPKQYKVVDGKTVEILEDGSYKELPNKYSKIAPNIVASKEAREAAKNERVKNAENLQANETVSPEGNTIKNIAPNIAADKEAKEEQKALRKKCYEILAQASGKKESYIKMTLNSNGKTLAGKKRAEKLREALLQSADTIDQSTIAGFEGYFGDISEGNSSIVERALQILDGKYEAPAINKIENYYNEMGAEIESMLQNARKKIQEAGENSYDVAVNEIENIHNNFPKEDLQNDFNELYQLADDTVNKSLYNGNKGVVNNEREGNIYENNGKIGEKISEYDTGSESGSDGTTPSKNRNDLSQESGSQVAIKGLEEESVKSVQKQQDEVTAKENKEKYSTTQDGKQNQMFNTEQFKNGQQMLFDTSDMPKTAPETKKTTVTMKSGKEKEIEYVEEIPEGYIEDKGATTAPKGYTWYHNNKSITSGERKRILVKDKTTEKSSEVEKDINVPSKNDNYVDEVTELLSNNDNSRKVDIGAVNDRIKEVAKKENIDLEGYRHNIDKSSVNHILNRHGEGENYRNQAPITEEDIKNIPDIIYNADSVEYSGKNNLGKDTFKYSKKMSDGVIYYVEEVRTGKKTLTTNSMYKKGGRSNVQEPKSSTSETTSTNDIITHNEENLNTNKKSEPKKKEVSEKSEKYEDYGEKIWGAKKDLWVDYKKKLKEEVKTDDVSKVKLNDVFPEPNWESLIKEGTNPELLAIVKACRDIIPAKPKGSKVYYYGKRWLEQLNTFRTFAAEVMDGNITPEQIDTALDKIKADSLRDVINTYKKVGYPAFLNIKGFKITKDLTTWENGKELSPAEWRYWVMDEKNKYGGAAGVFKTEKEAVEFLQRVASYAKEPKTKDVKLDIYKYRGERAKEGWIVGKKIGSNYVDLKTGFNTSKEAREYLNNNKTELITELNRLKEEPVVRTDVNEARVGGDYRNGVDVTPEDFANTFGFRGIQFGNYVEDSKRIVDINSAYDAFMDMIGIINIPEKAVSLNGSLGMAFGARGSGGKNPAAAHYESGEVVINLTKNRGRGSLAHEWWHALDNYFGKKNNDTNGFATEHYIKRGEIRQEVLDAFADIRKAVRNALEERSLSIDSFRSKDYWSQIREMTARSFEAYIRYKANKKGISNDYLANIINEESYNSDTKAYPYPTKAEMPEIEKAFDKFFKTLKTRETEKGVELYDEEFNPIKPIVKFISNVNKYFETKEAIKSGSSFEDLSNNNEIFKAIREELENRTDYNGNTLFEHIKDYTFTDMVKADKTPNRYGKHVGEDKAIYINTEAIEALPQNEQTGRFINTVRHEIEHAIQEKQHNDIVKTRGLKDSELKIFDSLAEELVKEKPSSNIISTLNSIINKIANKRNLRNYEVEALKDYAELKVVNKQKSEYYKKHNDVLKRYFENTLGKTKVEARKVYNNLKQSHKIIVDNYTRFFNNYYNTKYEANARKTGETKAKEVINANNGRTALQLPRLSKQRNVGTRPQNSSPPGEFGEASEEFGFGENADEEIKQRGAIDTLGKYDKEMADAVTDREYVVRGIKKVEKDISNMSEKEIEDILNSDEISDIKSVVLAHNIKDSIKNGEVPISKLNKWASEGTKIGQAMQSRKAIAPETLEEAVIKMHTYNTEKAPKAAKKLLKDADKIVNQIKKSNNEIEKEFDNWLKEQENAIKNKKEYSQEGDKLALLKAMEKYREKKALRDKKAQEKAEAKLAKQEENRRKELEKEEENAKKELEKERQALIKAMEKYRSTKERQAIRELERANERKRKAVEKLIEERTVGLNKKKKADLIDNIMKLDENGGLTEDNVCKLINKMFGIKEVTPADIEELKKLEVNIKNAKTQREEDVAKGFMQKYILENSIGATWWDKIDSIRYINMLGSTKSRLLDFASTGVYQAVRLADNASVLVLDKLLTKKIFGTDRVTSGFYPVEYAKGFVQGAKEGYYDVAHGINTGRAGETVEKDGKVVLKAARYDLNRANAFKFKPLEPLKGFPKFKQGVENSFSVVEKFVSGMVRIPDRAFFNGRYNASLIDQLRARGMKLEKAAEYSSSQLSEYLTNVAMQEEIEQAVNEARENVFQRECAASMAAAKIRSVANGIVPKSGDILFPFIHTTSVISQDVAERIGLGFVKGLKQIHNIRKNGGSTGQIRDAYNSIAKSITGAIIIMLGVGARFAGKDDDSDKTYSDTEVSGEHSNSLNIGKTSLNAKDIPFLTIPYNLAKALSSGDEEIMYKGILKAFDDIADVNPIASTYKESIKQSNGVKNKPAKDVLTEFIANALYTPAAQVGQNATLRDIRGIVDPYQRETYEPDKPFKTAANRFKNSTPFLSKSLPLKYNAVGELVKKNDGNNLVERAVSGLITGHKHIKEDETYNTYKKLAEGFKDAEYEGKNNILMQKIKHSIDVNGQKYKMSAKEFSDFQRDYGRINHILRTQLINNTKNGKSYSNKGFAKEVSEIQNSAIEAVKITQLGHVPSRYKNGNYILHDYTIDILQNYDELTKSN